MAVAVQQSAVAQSPILNDHSPPASRVAFEIKSNWLVSICRQIWWLAANLDALGTARSLGGGSGLIIKIFPNLKFG